MRLMKVEDNGNLTLTEFIGDSDVPPYAILSHTWGWHEEEVTYKDFVDGSGISKAGYAKINFCKTEVIRDGLKFFWIDTACIDKSSSAELSEAINSMFRWYHHAKKCYVYLSDVASEQHIDSLRASRWFKRGWTLQELLAPPAVEFFAKDGKRLGDKQDLEQMLHEITRIPFEAMRGGPLSIYGVNERLLWAEDRQTKREEDAAYALLGIFDVNMPLVYGEGKQKAMKRLRKEIRDTLADFQEPTGLDLYNALREDRIELVISLIQRGVSVDYVLHAGDNDTILHMAIRCGSGRSLDAVLQADPMLDAYNGQGITPLMLAAALGNVRAAKKLVDAGCALESKMQAVRKVQDPLLDFSDQLTSGSTALILAAQNGRSNVVRLLLDKGANVNAKADLGTTALHAASFHGHTPCIKLLLEEGANTEQQGIDGFLPLTYCAHYGWIKPATLLLDAGADIEAEKDAGMTPLLEAAWDSQWKMIEFLAQRGANMAAKVTWEGYYGGFTALHVGVQWNHKKMVETLLKCGADQTLRNNAGETPEELAKNLGHHNILKVFQEQGRDHVAGDELNSQQ